MPLGPTDAATPDRPGADTDVTAAGTDAGAGMVDAGPFNLDGTAAMLPSTRAIIPNNGGMTYENPTYVVVDFAGDPNASFVENYVQTFATSTLFPNMLQEYGVTGATYGSAYHMADPPCTAPCMLTYSNTDQAADILDTAISNGTIPAPGPETIYLSKLPPGITASGGCDYGYSYHGWEPSMGFAYDVIYECPDPDLGPSEILGEDLSHEMMEAATDPMTGYGPGWVLRWDPQGGEICDYCGDDYTLLGGYTVQRVYSNAAAMSGRDPCIPYGTGPFPNAYVAAGPTVSTLTVARNGPPVTLTVNVFASAGASGTVDVSANGSQGINVSPQTYSVLSPGATTTFSITADSTARPGAHSSVWVFSNPDSAQYAYEEWPVEINVQ